jgi:hypothetical protein
MAALAGFMEFGKKHSQVYLDAPGLCPSCLERYIVGRTDGAEIQLVAEVVDGVATGKRICPDGGRSYAKQFIDETGDIYGAFPSVVPSPTRLLSRGPRREKPPEQP